jgi:hypothetical protein
VKGKLPKLNCGACCKPLLWWEDPGYELSTGKSLAGCGFKNNSVYLFTLVFEMEVSLYFLDWF